MRTPQILYVRVEKDGDEEYLVAGRTLEELVPPEDGKFVLLEYAFKQRHSATSKRTILFTE